MMHERTPLHRFLILALPVMLLLGLAGCTAPEETPAEVPTPPVQGEPDSTAPAEPPGVETGATGLDSPWSIVFVDGVALVSERDTAKILEIGVDGAKREVATVAGVKRGGEGGLLGLAEKDGYLYTYFTAAEDNRIVRHELLGTPGSFALGDSETVIAGLPAANIHNGGRIKIGPDGMVYITTGDAADKPTSQDLGSLGGKILRVTPDGDIPPDNPFPDSPVWSYGHRNVQGIAWGEDGTMYASEFGANTWDELNVIEPGGNYGWPEVEGIAGDSRFVDPVQQWATSEASPSGIAVADGAVHIANLRGQRLRSVPLDDLSTATERFVGEYGRLRDVVVAPDGRLWILTNNTDGRGMPRKDDDRVLILTP